MHSGQALRAGVRRSAGLAVAAGAVGFALALDAALSAERLVTLAYVLASALILQAQGLLLRVRRLAFPPVWWFFFVLLIVLPSGEVARDAPPYAAELYIRGIRASLLCVPFGILAATLVTGFRPREVDAFYERPVTGAVHSERAMVVTFGVLCTAALGLVANFFREVPDVPLFFLIRNPGEAELLGMLREQSFKLLDSAFGYWYDMLRRVFFPFLVSIALLQWWRTGSARWRNFSLAFAAVAFVFAGAATAKMVVAAFLLVLLLARFIYRGGRMRIGVGLAGIVAIAAYPFAIMMLSLTGSGFDAAYVWRLLYIRTFVSPATDLLAYFEIFPAHIDYLWGRGIGKIALLTSQQYFDVENFTHRYMYPFDPVTGTNTAAFPGTAHANFGFMGVVLFGLLAGFIMQLTTVWLVRGPKTVVRVAAMATLFWCWIQINLQGLQTSLLSGGVGPIVALVLAIELAEYVASPGRRASGTATHRLGVQRFNA